MTTESMVTQADFDRAAEETNRLCRELDITNADHIALWIEHNTIPDEPMNQCAGWLACRIVEAHEVAVEQVRKRWIETVDALTDELEVVRRHRTAAQPEREAVLEEHFPTGLRSTRHVLRATGEVFESPIQCECHCGACFVGTDEQEVRQLWAAHAAALTTPAPAVKPHCSTCGKDVAEVLCETCGKWWAENLPAPAVSRDEIAAALEEATDAIDQLERSVRFLTPENVRPDTSNARALVERARAILSRLRGEGE